MAFRFLHLADLHLETSFGGREATRARLRRATLEAFERAVDFALERDLHAVLVAGDLFDDALLSLETELFLVRQVRRLTDAGTWFLYACGNHDPGGPNWRVSDIGLDAASEREDPLAGASRVRVFREAAPAAVTVRDRRGEAVGAVVGAGHAGPQESANLAAALPQRSGALPQIALLHSHVEQSESAAAHDRYAPSSASDYRRRDYQYFALGHIHVRQRIAEGIPAFYPGNLQGRNARETGEKGGLVVEAHAGIPAEPDFVRFAPVRWVQAQVSSLPDERSASALSERLARGIEKLRASPAEEIAVRLELSGATPLAATLRAPERLIGLTDELRERCGVLELDLRAAGVRLPVDREDLRRAPTLLAETLALIERAERDPALLDGLAPARLARDVAPGPERSAYLRALLAGAADDAVLRFVVAEDA
jgi:DNA repair exonuclease SbcCD nuclease subunit